MSDNFDPPDETDSEKLINHSLKNLMKGMLLFSSVEEIGVDDAKLIIRWLQIEINCLEKFILLKSTQDMLNKRRN